MAKVNPSTNPGGEAAEPTADPLERLPLSRGALRWLRPVARVLNIRVGDLGALVALVLLVGVFAALAPGFRTFDNLITVSRQVSVDAVIAAGMTMVIITAGIDLGVGSLVAVASVLVASLLTEHDLNVGLAVLLTLLVLGAFGAFNGFVIAKVKLPPFIATLAMFAAARGLAQVYTNGEVIIVDNEDFLKVGLGYVGPIPVPVIIAAVVLLLAHVTLSRTKFGRYVYAIGGNEEAARISGIPVDRVKASVYVISGLVSAIGGIILTARLLAGDPQAGVGAELDVIAAVVIGGTSLFGGVGNIRGTLIGALIIGVISNGLTILDVQTFWQSVVKGIVILLAITIDTQLRRVR
jgi:ribose/xylose/arabinose/galactoside ABC-type transport system permease subunit